MATKPITRKDVALEAGVSPSTVSLVLNNTPGINVAAGTRERIVAAAQRLRYRPNSIAKALVSGKTMTIGVALHYVKTPFTPYVSGVLSGFWNALSVENYRILVCNATEAQILGGLFHDRAVDGVLVMAPPLRKGDEEFLQACKVGFPVVQVGAHTSLQQEYSYVDVDNVRVGYLATRALIEAGHKKIIHFAGALKDNSSALDRLQGFRMAMEEAGLEASRREVIDCSYNPEIMAENFRKLLDSRQPFTAIYSAGEDFPACCYDILAERKLRIPDDISIIKGGLPGEDVTGGGMLARCVQPVVQIGKQAATSMLALLRGESRTTHLLAPEYIPGNSIAPPSDTFLLRRKNR